DWSSRTMVAKPFRLHGCGETLCRRSSMPMCPVAPEVRSWATEKSVAWQVGAAGARDSRERVRVCPEGVSDLLPACRSWARGTPTAGAAEACAAELRGPRAPTCTTIAPITKVLSAARMRVLPSFHYTSTHV